MINQENIGDICNSLKLSFTNRCCLYMKEFAKGLKSYHIMQLAKDYPNLCEERFVSKYAQDTIPDADSLFLLFQWQFAKKGTARRATEENMAIFKILSTKFLDSSFLAVVLGLVFFY